MATHASIEPFVSVKQIDTGLVLTVCTDVFVLLNWFPCNKS